MTGSTSIGKYSDSLSHGDEVVLCATSLKTRSKSASCTVHFTDCSLIFSHSSLLMFQWYPLLLSSASLPLALYLSPFLVSFSLQYFFFLLLFFPC